MLFLLGIILLILVLYMSYSDLETYMRKEDYWSVARLSFAFAISWSLIILGAIYGK